MIPLRSKNAGAWAAAMTTEAWAETSTRSPRPVASRWNKRDERADGRLRSRPAVGLRLAHPQRHPVGFAGERHRAAGGHQFDVGSPPILARSDAAERRDGDDHQTRKTLAQGIGIKRFVGQRRSRRQQADIGLGKELLDLRLIGRLRRVEIEDAFVDIEGAPVGPRAIGRRRLELDDIGAEIGEDPSGKPAEPVRRINDDYPCQQHGGSTGLSHRPVRANECTHPTMRDLAFSMSFLVKKSSGLTLSTG